jgi:hypothetical protein
VNSIELRAALHAWLPAATGLLAWRVRRVRRITGAALAAVLVAGAMSATATARSGMGDEPGPDARSAFHVISPCRVVDTRETSPGATLASVPRTIDIQLTGRCGVPSGISAVALSVTATNTRTSSFAAVGPLGAAVATSSLNWLAGETRAASVVVAVSPEGVVSIRAGDDLGNVDFVVDVTGAWIPVTGPVAAGRLVTLPGRRVLDTRQGAGPVAAGGFITISPTTLGLPDGAMGVAGTLTITGGNAPGFLTAFPAGHDVPVASNVNTDDANQSRAAGIIVALGDDGLSIHAGAAAANVVFDVTGYITGPTADASNEGLLVPIVPERLLDTRDTSGASRNAGVQIPVTYAGSPISGVIGTITATDVSAPGFARVHAAGVVTPAGWIATATSALNWDAPGGAVASMMVHSIGFSGYLSVTALTPASIIVDATAYLLAGGGSTANRPESTEPRPIPVGEISDRTEPDNPAGEPLVLLEQMYTINQLRAGGGVAIIAGLQGFGACELDPEYGCAPAMVAHDPADYPECGSEPLCILLDSDWWNSTKPSAVDANRAMIGHEWAHVLSMRYQAAIPMAEYDAWMERRNLVHEECLADAVNTIALARSGNPPNTTQDYEVRYQCAQYWVDKYGAERLQELETLAADLAIALLDWAETWGAAHSA